LYVIEILEVTVRLGAPKVNIKN